MKTIFNHQTREELISRVNSLNNNNQAQWGKMNVYEMIQHCTLGNEMLLGKLPSKRVFIGRILGPYILKKVLQNEDQLRKNTPTAKELIAHENPGDIENLKAALQSRINEFANHNESQLIHPFFGRMTKEQVGLLAYKHQDHHLRQFGV
ncbi:MAG: DUF1569 domain-containing protein [Bacteroidetes bacterium]|nr:DUF1569 domain-containing protein [Bacteroidota bacterium]